MSGDPFSSWRPRIMMAVKAEALARRAAAAKLVAAGTLTQAQAESDAKLWRALGDWARDAGWQKSASAPHATLAPPACGWERAATATDKSARKALDAYKAAGGDEASSQDISGRAYALGQHWAALNIAHHAAMAGLDKPPPQQEAKVNQHG
jgi:hypothetical protein